MKYLLVFLSLIIFSIPAYCDDEFNDIDYNFIEHAFEGIKPVTDEEFNKTINKLTPQPVEDTFGGKLKTFLFGRKYGVDNPTPSEQQQDNDIGGEAKAIADMKNGVYYIKLVVSVKNNEGNIMPLGNYKIKEKDINNEAYLAFYQGTKEYGVLKLRKFEDKDHKDKTITYSRVDIVNDDIVRIVYSTLKETRCAYARIYNGN